MIAVIRIAGMIGIKRKDAETLDRMRLRRKYACVLLEDKGENKGKIDRVRNFIAYGEISEEVLVKLIKARAKKLGNKKAKIENPEKIAKDIISGKKFEEIGIKPFFRLHPPIGGIDTKQHYPRGVLGNHKENINKLVERML